MIEDLASTVRKAAEAMAKTMPGAATLPFDPFTLAATTAEFMTGLAARPADLLEAQMVAAKQWTDFWTRALDPAAEPSAKPKDRRFAAAAWQEDPYHRAIRDAYLLASEQLRGLTGTAQGSGGAMVRFLLDQYLNAAAPTNFALTNPEVIERTRETGGANLIQGFAHLLEDLASGQGIVKRRTAPDVFVKGETIAATPGEVVFQNDLFQLIQYTPSTAEVAAEPLLYVPPLVNRFYMIDLVPRSSLVKWLVDQGRTVFVVSWVNPSEAHRDKDVEAYVLEGVVTAIAEATKRAGTRPDLFAFCLGGTLVAIALAYLAAKGRAAEVNSATLIGSMVDFADMRDWSAFAHEGHLAALDGHLDKQGFIDAAALQRLFAAMRANDLIWSSVVNHYLLDKTAPPSDLLYWFEDGARIPAAFLKSFNRDILLANKLRESTGFAIGGEAIDLSRIDTPMMVVALKDDHVSAWEAVYDGARLLRADYVLGGSGHNAGVINPPAANKHGYWISDASPVTAREWLEGATKHEGSWWPYWEGWLAAHGSGKKVKARRIKNGLEPAPGSYAKAP